MLGGFLQRIFTLVGNRDPDGDDSAVLIFCQLPQNAISRNRFFFFLLFLLRQASYVSCWISPDEFNYFLLPPDRGWRLLNVTYVKCLRVACVRVRNLHYMVHILHVISDTCSCVRCVLDSCEYAHDVFVCDQTWGNLLGRGTEVWQS